MSVTLKRLCTENGNPFKLTLLAGSDSIRNAVTWVYVLEDEYIIRYFHGSELAVTTGSAQAHNPDWLMMQVRELVKRRAAGLIINTGNYIMDVPQEIIDYCNQNDLPLFAMPWEIRITEMIQTFCTRIVNEQHESTVHDKAMRDAILKRANEEEYTEILSKYYYINGKFIVIAIQIYSKDDDIKTDEDMEYILLNQIRRFKTTHHLKSTLFGLVHHEDYELVILNNVDSSFLPEIQKIIFNVYHTAFKAGVLFVGVGSEVTGLSNISQSYQRASTALRMAVYRDEPVVQFEEMGFYKILFSVKDEEVLSSYANEILSPLDAYDSEEHEFTILLKTYIENDRSLEKTAEALFLHRNTVNYRIQKMKKILHSPLKTVVDLFPFQVALAIRDMEAKK